MRVFIHSGHLSLDNGAVAPLSLFFDIARMLQVSPDCGNYYGDDSVVVGDEDWQTLEALLIESKLLYRVEGQHPCWQNVVSEEVQRKLARNFVH